MFTYGWVNESQLVYDYDYLHGYWYMVKDHAISRSDRYIRSIVLLWMTNPVCVERGSHRIGLWIVWLWVY